MYVITKNILVCLFQVHLVFVESCDEEITMHVVTEFYEQSVKSASSYTKTVRSSSKFKRSLGSLAVSESVSASVSGGFAGFTMGFSAEASASYASVKESVESSSKFSETISSDKVEFNTGFLQIIRKIETKLIINGNIGVVIEKEFVDSVPIAQSLSGAQLQKRGEDYMKNRFSGREVGNKFTETVCYSGTCQGSCCWKGPTRTILESGGRAQGAGWAEKFATIQECARRCEELVDCRAFHYYGRNDNYYTDCYLHKHGEISLSLDENRDRYAGVCGTGLVKLHGSDKTVHLGDDLEPSSNKGSRARGPGTGTTSDWTFCSRSSPCGKGQGDFDGDDQCQFGLYCGRDNCQDFTKDSHRLADCCVKRCPSSWKHFGSNCYKVFNNQLNWYEAEQFCQGQGGNLASVHSAGENNFLTGLTSARHWLGGNDAVFKFKWLWSDGTEWSFTDWKADQPDDSGNQEKCLEKNLKSTQWNDIGCSNLEQKQVLCKIKQILL